MIIEFPTKENVFECFDCGEVRKLRDGMPVCEECPEPQTKDEMSFLGGKFQVRGWVRAGYGDDDFWSSILDTCRGIYLRGIYTEEQFRTLQRIVTLGRGRNLQVVK